MHLSPEARSALNVLNRGYFFFSIRSNQVVEWMEHTLAFELISCCNSRAAKGAVVCDISVTVLELFTSLDVPSSSNLYSRAIKHNHNVGLAIVVHHGCSQVDGRAQRRISKSLVDRYRVASDL